jgi:PPOX class probable F420-dependent enzyme
MSDAGRGPAGTDGGRGWLAAGMELADALDFVRSHRRSVMATVRKNGRPQLSNVLHGLGDDGIVRVSITADRAKYHNLVREPWLALHVTSDDFWRYAVLEGEVELSPVVERPDDPAVDEMVAHYRAVVGDLPDEDAFRRGQVAERRVLVRLRPTRAYGMLQPPPRTEDLKTEG